MRRKIHPPDMTADLDSLTESRYGRNMPITEPPAAAGAPPTLAAPGGRPAPEQANPVRPVSPAINPGAEALYASEGHSSATPWERRSHAFRAVYLKRARIVLDGGLPLGPVADHMADHERDVTRPNEIACICDLVFDLPVQFAIHRASEFRAWALGEPS